MDLSLLLQAADGKPLNIKDRDFTKVSTDSRKNTQGTLFFALKGDSHDAHDYVENVVKQGVAAVVVHKFRQEWKPLLKDTTWVVVDDTLKALQDFSAVWRQMWGQTVIGVTGSNGKTSVKDFTAAMLSRSRKVLKSEGSFNNHWGVPLTLLELRSPHQVAVVEMGMNHLGEISNLKKIAQPNIVAVTNVGRAHMGHFSGLDEIASAKKEIYGFSQKRECAVYNLANKHTAKMYEETSTKFSVTYTFGAQGSDVFLTCKSMSVDGLEVTGTIAGKDGEATVPVWGQHNIENLMAASALCLATGMAANEIWNAMPSCKSTWGRNQWLKLNTGQDLLFDGYNANPDSFVALITNLKSMKKRPEQVVAVFGEMKEQGDNADAFHYELGALVAESPVTNCLFVGESHEAFKEGFEKNVKNEKMLALSDSYEQDLALKLKSMLHPRALIVVKGSRGSALERVVRDLGAVEF